MNRKKFLIIAGVSTGSLIVPSGIYFVSGSVKKYAALLIKKQLSYLKLETNSVETYVEDYFQGNNDLMAKLRWKTMYYLGITWENSNTLKDLIKYYLLSTDFFINKMDESKNVKYLGLYSPYKSPVPNPFAYTLYPPN
ncbi:hypothetical protein [Pedobacter sp.]|uniref:hypothetical protein n=1 Tax=Pedobacter sp. TaxID=1411316 RepID=UPI003BAB74AB